MNETVAFARQGQFLRSGVKTPLRVPVVAEAGPTTAAAVIERLEQAGATLLAIPNCGPTTRMRQMRFDVVHSAAEAYGWAAPPIRPPAPNAAAITAMDEAFLWLHLIPEESYLLRRILGARALVHPITGRHLYAWRRLAGALGTDHKSVQRWHAKGVAIILAALTAGT